MLNELEESCLRAIVHVLQNERERYCSLVQLSDKAAIPVLKVQKAIDSLYNMGVVLQQQQGSYRLISSVCFFNKISIQHAVPRAKIYYRISLPSTNRCLQNRFCCKSVLNVCLADHQSAGKGSRARRWISPLGSNCYFSTGVLWPEAQREKLQGFSLVVGVFIINALEKIGVTGLQLKWPNDLLYRGKKLGGILIEVDRDTDTGDFRVIIGIGINFHVHGIEAHTIEREITDVFHIVRRSLDKNDFVVQFLKELENAYSLCCTEGFQSFKQYWDQYDFFKGCDVVGIQRDTTLEGRYLGVDAFGNALIRYNGEVRVFSCGTLSLKKK